MLNSGTDKNRGKPFIIVIGASAGGLNAISEVVSQLPEDLNAAVFIVIHLSKVGLGNFLVHRLQKYTPFTCTVAINGEKIEPGRIYIAPPDHNLMVNENNEVALEHGRAENGRRPSIDVLFQSAAVHYTNKVIGIILTGYHNDGTIGMSTIKNNGGYCIVQHPNEAEYPDMPSSVLENNEVDYCIRLREVGDAIQKIVKTAEPEPEEGIDDDQLKETEIEKSEHTVIDVMNESGQRASFACPDCGGELISVNNNNIKTYRCHVGHSFSETELLLRLGESIESPLWVALRVMEERRLLLTKINEEEIRRGLTKTGHYSQQKLKELEKNIDQLKDLLFTVQKR